MLSPTLLVFHLKDYSKVSACHHRLPIISKHRTKISQLLEVVFCSLDGLYVF